MYRTAKSLELVEVEVYGCFILCPYLFLHKTLILCKDIQYEYPCFFISSSISSIIFLEKFNISISKILIKNKNS